MILPKFLLGFFYDSPKFLLGFFYNSPKFSNRPSLSSNFAICFDTSHHIFDVGIVSSACSTELNDSQRL